MWVQEGSFKTADMILIMSLFKALSISHNPIPHPFIKSKPLAETHGPSLSAANVSYPPSALPRAPPVQLVTLPPARQNHLFPEMHLAATDLPMSALPPSGWLVSAQL